jgi:WD40 repeat protein
MKKHELLTQMREVLRGLYRSQRDAETFVDDAQINAELIDFGGSADNRWHSILAEADRQYKLDEVFETGLKRYPDNPELLAVQKLYQEWRTVGESNGGGGTNGVGRRPPSCTLTIVLGALLVVITLGGGSLVTVMQTGHIGPFVFRATDAPTIALPSKTPSATPQNITRTPLTATPTAAPLTRTATPTAVIVTVTPTSAVTRQPVSYTFERALPVGGKGMAWSPDGQTVAVSTRDGIVLYNAADWSEGRTLAGGEYGYGALFSPDGTLLIALTTEGLHVYQAPNWREVTKVAGVDFDSSATSSYFAAFSPDGRELAVSVGETVKLYETRNWTETGLLLTGDVNALAFAPDGKHIATAAWGQLVALWDIETRSQVRTFGQPGFTPNRLAFTPDGTGLLVAGLGGGSLILWNTEDSTERQTFEGHTDTVNSLQFSRDGRTLLTASGDLTLRLWDVETGAILQTPLGHTHEVNEAVFSPDAARIASTSTDGTTRIWTAAKNKITPTPNALQYERGATPTLLPLAANAIAPENASRVSATTVIPQRGRSVAWSPDMKLLAVARWRGCAL